MFVEAAVSTATIMMMVGLSKASSYVITTSGLPQQLLDLVHQHPSQTTASSFCCC